MKGPLRLLACAALGFAASPAAAQLQVEIVDALPNYLLYEPILLKIRVRNGTGRIVDFEENTAQSWLRFLVMREGGLMVRPTKEFVQPRMTLEPGDEARFTFNLTPFYGLRDVGAYQVQAVVRVAGLPGDVLSRPTRFNVLRGHTVWTKEVTPPGIGSPRRFSLITHLVRDPRQRLDRTYIFAQVESESENLVFTCRPLGPLMQGDRIESEFDASYGWHVLFRSTGSDYVYCQFDIEGRQVERKELSKAATRPRLMSGGGTIEVVGGLSREEAAGDSLRGTQPAEVLMPGRGIAPNAERPSPAPDAPPPRP